MTSSISTGRVHDLEDGTTNTSSTADIDAPHAPQAPQAPDEPRCLVVMYHYVHDVEPLPRIKPSGPTSGVRGLTRKDFGAQIDRLCREMEPIDWPALFAWTQGRRSLPDRSFLLSFDDGLADHAQHIFPILEQRGIRGTFFVPGSVLTSRRLLPAHAVHLLLGTIDEQQFEREALQYLRERYGHDAVPSPGEMQDPQQLYDYETPLRARLKHYLTMVLPASMRDEAVSWLFEKYIGSTARWAQHWYMGWDQLVEMQSRGHTIGGHGYMHEPFSRMTQAQRCTDLKRSAEVLSAGLGADMRPFSYPLGRHDRASRQACRDAGFIQAFTTEANWVSRGVDTFQLPRVDTIGVTALLDGKTTCAQA